MLRNQGLKSEKTMCKFLYSKRPIMLSRTSNQWSKQQSLKTIPETLSFN